MTAAAPVLNLNNEVVKMRKDVKKVKALIIRKLIRHVSKLKSKKGTEELVLKNQRRAQRLLEEIQSIKKLKPDDVTKTALRKEINSDTVFNMADSDAETRAVTRLVTHPLLKQKISAIKDAVKAFKKARMNQAEQEAEPEKPSLPSKPAKRVKCKAENKPKERKLNWRSKMEETKLENTIMDSPVVETVDKEIETDPTASKHSNEEFSSPTTPHAPASQAAPEGPSEKNILLSSSDKDTVQNKAKKKMETDLTTIKHGNEESSSPTTPQASASQTAPEGPSEKNILLSSSDKDTGQHKAKKKTETDLTTIKHSNEESSSPTTPQASASQAAPQVPSENNIFLSSSDKDTVQNAAEKKMKQSNRDQKAPSNSDSSDLEDLDKEDKEYFDDSTEERFLKQTPGFEDSDSDSDNDFFIGKLRRTKKKKTSKTDDLVKKDKLPPATTKPLVNSREEQRAITGPKNVKLESVFCTLLAETKQKSSYMKRESKLPPVRNKKSVIPQANTLSRKSQSVKTSTARQQSNVKDQTLHPSWEASRKRKEQSQIAVFQGKKIVFDD